MDDPDAMTVGMKDDAVLFGEFVEALLEIAGRAVQPVRELCVVGNRTGVEQRANELRVQVARFHALVVDSSWSPWDHRCRSFDHFPRTFSASSTRSPFSSRSLGEAIRPETTGRTRSSVACPLGQSSATY